MKIALINTNSMQPPIAPIGLDYVAEALAADGHSVQLLDLCWEPDPNPAIAKFLSKSDFELIGMTLRNTDDCAFINCQSFLTGFVDLVKTVRNGTSAPIVLGGVGFSVMPEKVLSLSGAEFGVWGDGEFAVAELANKLEKTEGWHDLPNLLWHDRGKVRRNPPSWKSLAGLPPMSRSWVDNKRYFRHGGQAGFETKRGCTGACIYCADPPAKGKRVRLRPPTAVADELEKLLEQDVDVLHTCDAEFNVPERHALETCSEMIRRGLGNRIRWYAYCSPGCFSEELARTMRRAGCVGINFGADNGSDEMLRRLGRDFGSADILNAARWAKKEGMGVMLDLLLGAPGETKESIEQTVELMKRAEPDRVGVAVGVRIYPGTGLDAQTGGGDSLDPAFFLEPKIAPFVFDWLANLIGEDRRFLFLDPSKPKQNYNYNANQRLVDAIQNGYRGAYWDILRLIEESR
jgi:tryptophan 2-C-methyltransferase